MAGVADPINTQKTLDFSDTYVIGIDTNIVGYSVQDGGATGNGTTNDYAAIVSAQQTAARKGVALFFPAGTYYIGSNFTSVVPIVMAAGAQIVMGVGATFTVSKSFQAPLTQVFSTASGSVVFTTGVPVYPEWWGAQGDGITNDYAAIQAAINAYPNGVGSVVFRVATYLTGSTLTISNTQSSLSLIGAGVWRATSTEGPTISGTFTSAIAVLQITGTGGTLENVRIVGLNITRQSMGVIGSYAILAAGLTNWYLTDCAWSNAQYGLYINGGNGPYILRCNASNQGQISGQPCYGIYMTGATTAVNGINIDGLVYYGAASAPIGTLYGVYINGGVGSSGDIRVANLEVTNNVHYGIYLADNSGFSDDVHFERFTMDAILVAGITLTSVSNQTFQMASIVSGWINLVASAGTVYGIVTTLRSGTMCSNVKIANSTSGTAVAKAFSFQGAQSGLITGCYLVGLAWSICVEYILSGATRSDFNQINGLNIQQIGSQGAINLTACSSGAIVNVLSPNSTLTVATGSNYNRLYCIVVGSYVNNGTGTVQV